MKRIKSRKKLAFFLIICLFVCVLECAHPVYSENAEQKQYSFSSFCASGRIWIAGDSIAADHSYEKESAYKVFVHGWGEMIGNYLSEDAVVFNKAISGQTAKFFTQEQNYRDIMNEIGEGDFLLIQFGHNDYKSAGYDHAFLSTDTEGSYKWYLKNYYIDPALKAGAMPVLCTSVVCCQTDDYGMVKEEQDQKKFVEAMRELYKEYRDQGTEIGLIDTFGLTYAFLNADYHNIRNYYAVKYDNGKDGSTSLDHVHFSAQGADMTARLIARNLFYRYPDFNRFNLQKPVDGGKGTEDEPYLISSWLQFYQIMQDDKKNTPEMYYQLTSDLMPEIQHQSGTAAFYANLDGHGHTAKNAVGMFWDNVLDENYGTIFDLNLNYNLAYTTQNLQAPFVQDNYGAITGCSASGSLKIQVSQNGAAESWFCGMFADVNHEGGTLEQCRNQARLSVCADVPQIFLGGIAGCNEGKIKNCTNTQELSLDSFEYNSIKALAYKQIVCCAGGIAGIMAKDSEITGSENTKLPKCLTKLNSDNLVKLTDLIVPITKEELAELNTEDQSVRGDVDGDHIVTLKDVQLALRIYLHMETNDNTQLNAADLDADGKVGLKEVQSILRIYLKIE